MNKNQIFAIIGLLIMTGCAGEKATVTGGTGFIGGTESIKFDFLEGAPPLEVYDGGTFPFEVSLNLENKGEYDVAASDVKIKLMGFYPADFGSPTIEQNPTEALGKTYIDSEGNRIPGTVSYLTFTGFNFVGNLVANNEYTIRADMCYKYGTLAQADLCILEDLTKSEGKVCKANEAKTVTSSSAPIKVENFIENIAGADKITFSFDIVHRGTGAISKLATDCSDEIADKNKVHVKIDTGTLGGLTCSGLDGVTGGTEGDATLYGGKRLIRCTLPTGTPTADFEKKVNIELTYQYKEHKERKILVKHTV
ncbi:MAG: hypothetical protein ABIC04_05600 [Nanoarchaeota archaeon]